MAGPFVGENADLEGLLRDLEQRRDRRVGTLDISDIISSVPVVQIKVLNTNENKVRTSSGSGANIDIESTQGMEQGEVMIFHLWEDSGMEAAVEMADEPTQRGTTTTTVENRDMPRTMRFTVRAADGTDVPRVSKEGVQSQDDMTMREQISNLLNLRGAKVQAIASKPGLVLTGLVRNVSVQDQGTHDNVTTVSVEVRETTAQGGDAKGKRLAEKGRFRVPVNGEDDGEDDSDQRDEMDEVMGPPNPFDPANFGGRCVMRALPTKQEPLVDKEAAKKTGEILVSSAVRGLPGGKLVYQAFVQRDSIAESAKRAIDQAGVAEIPRKPIGEGPGGGTTYIRLDSLEEVRGSNLPGSISARERVTNRMKNLIGDKQDKGEEAPHFLRPDAGTHASRLELVIYRARGEDGERFGVVQEALVNELLGDRLGNVTSVTNSKYGEC